MQKLQILENLIDTCVPMFSKTFSLQVNFIVKMVVNEHFVVILNTS